MTENYQRQELQDRLNLIESMIAEGRRKTESWGWTFLLWGVACYVAMAWATLGHSNWAWPVTMSVAWGVTAVVSSAKRRNRPRTRTGSSIGFIWAAVGISMFLLLISLSISGKADQHVMMACLSAMLGTANAASSMVLKWKAQFACALVWWSLTVFACFGTGDALTIAYLAALFFCQIVFGIYAMICDARRKRLQGVAHV